MQIDKYNYKHKYKLNADFQTVTPAIADRFIVLDFCLAFLHSACNKIMCSKKRHLSLRVLRKQMHFLYKTNKSQNNKRTKLLPFCRIIWGATVYIDFFENFVILTAKKLKVWSHKLETLHVKT